MLQAGHVLIDSEGALVSLDRGFSAIMRCEPEQMMGRQVLDITAPADREECGVAIATLRATHRPFRITKRFLRDDGSLVWVTNSVSVVESAQGAPMVVATIDPLVERPEDRSPGRLVECVAFLQECKAEREAICNPDLFPDTAWDLILATYLAEAEGRLIGLASYSEELGITPRRAARWVDILIAEDVLEVETRAADAYTPKNYRLSSRTYARLEAHLRTVNERRTPQVIDLLRAGMGRL